MPRNLVRRIEVIFPIEDEKIKDRIENNISAMLKDNTKARLQRADGSYEYIKNNAKKISSQDKNI